MTAEEQKFMSGARSRSLTPADLVRIELREVKALRERSNAGLYSIHNRKETK